MNTFVAGFIGSPAMNLVTLPVSNGSVSLGGVAMPIPASRECRARASSSASGPSRSSSLPDGIPGRVEVVEEIGADAFVFCAAQIAGEETKLVARAGAKHAPERGEHVFLRPSAEDAHLFDPVDGTRLG